MKTRRYFLQDVAGRAIVTTRQPERPAAVWFRTEAHAELVAERLNEGLPADQPEVSHDGEVTE